MSRVVTRLYDPGPHPQNALEEAAAMAAHEQTDSHAARPAISLVLALPSRNPFEADAMVELGHDRFETLFEGAVERHANRLIKFRAYIEEREARFPPNVIALADRREDR